MRKKLYLCNEQLKQDGYEKDIYTNESDDADDGKSDDDILHG